MHVKLLCADRIVSITQAEESIVELHGGFATAVVSGLKFAIFRDPPPSATAAVINLKAVTLDGACLYFTCRGSTLLYRFFKAFCNRQGVSMSAVRFVFDGNLVHPWLTPAQLNMEDGDVIDVMVALGGD